MENKIREEYNWVENRRQELIDEFEANERERNLSILTSLEQELIYKHIIHLETYIELIEKRAEYLNIDLTTK